MEEKIFKGKSFYYKDLLVLIIIVLIVSITIYRYFGLGIVFFITLLFIIIFSICILSYSVKLYINDEGMYYTNIPSKMKISWEEINSCYETSSYINGSASIKTGFLFTHIPVYIPDSGREYYGFVFKNLKTIKEPFFDSKNNVLFVIPKNVFYKNWEEIKKQISKKIEIKSEKQSDEEII
ncbi:hypothetical protein JXB41_01440 [Candidatus Woesearchaeota archaeon]|nr:hypothetical protein [Candidatus Woesearchaeota archaeon]